MTESGKRKLKAIGTAVTLAAALVAAFTMVGRLRLVDVLTLFFSGFAAGAVASDFIRGRMRSSRAGNP